MVAGPSEVTVVADKSSDPDLVAADLIAQAEHDIYAQSILITDNIKFIRLVDISLKKQLKKLPKKKIASKSLKKFGLAILTDSKKNMIEIINTIAPEHLELLTNNNEKIIKHVKNAGSIFIGKVFAGGHWRLYCWTKSCLANLRICKVFIRFISK